MTHAPPNHAVQHQAKTALDLLEAVCVRVQEGCPADSALQDMYRRRHELGSRDRRLYSNLIFAFFRWKGWTDLAPGLPLAIRAAAAYRLDFPDSHPAVDLLAQLAPPSTPLDSLAAKSRQIARWLQLDTPPAPLLLIPPHLAPLLALPDSDTPVDAATRLIEAFQIRPPTWLRVRLGSEAVVRDACSALGIVPVPHPRLPLAWHASDPARLADLLAACRGRVDIQDVASQAVGLLSGVEAGGDWWDVCAGAGGKSLHLADLALGRLHILATDARERVLAEAAKRVRHAGLERTIRMRRLDAVLDPLPAKAFDGVLVDAPCSGTGTWARNPDARWRTAPDRAAAFAETQYAILARVAGAVKPGGVLVYATCSLTRLENTGVLDRFLNSRSDFVLAPFLNPLTGKPAPGWTFFWPWDGPGSGMFAARLVRHQPLNPATPSFHTP
jgi:16S rRNA (cytosine967-C5)-methyltransferase